MKGETTDAMPSKEREVLEQIANGRMSWAPDGTNEADYEKFEAELTDLTDALDWLVSNDYIGGYDDSHTESHTRNRYRDRVLITAGLTFKGQDRSTWPN
jgi:hypothetical protein